MEYTQINETIFENVKAPQKKGAFVKSLNPTN
jgi:hypothetical protein